jgi:hypothetical protein
VKTRHPPPVHLIKPAEMREITPYRWVHPDEERRDRIAARGKSVDFAGYPNESMKPTVVERVI